MSYNSQILILRSSQTKADNFFVSCCFCNPSTACIFGTNWPISVGSVVKDSFANDVYNQSEKWKLNLTDSFCLITSHISFIAGIPGMSSSCFLCGLSNWNSHKKAWWKLVTGESNEKLALEFVIRDVLLKKSSNFFMGVYLKPKFMHVYTIIYGWPC